MGLDRGSVITDTRTYLLMVVHVVTGKLSHELTHLLVLGLVPLLHVHPQLLIGPRELVLGLLCSQFYLQSQPSHLMYTCMYD